MTRQRGERLRSLSRDDLKPTATIAVVVFEGRERFAEDPSPVV